MNTLAYRLVPGNNTWNRLGRELNRASSVQKSTAASILAPILSIHSRLIGQPFILRILLILLIFRIVLILLIFRLLRIFSGFS